MSTPSTDPDARPVSTGGTPDPVRADSLRHRFDENREPAPVSLRTVGIALLVSVVTALALTATVLGLQLLAMSLGTP